jgi:ABC-type Co2+ transport system permease subunit
VAGLIFLLAWAYRLRTLRRVTFKLSSFKFLSLTLRAARLAPFDSLHFRLIAHPLGTTMAWSFAVQFRGGHTVKSARLLN